MFLESGPIDTTGYMILGFSVIFGVLLIHLWSIRLRRINLNKDLELLKEISKKN